MKITIITVCYNSIKTIEKTIQSVVSQSYKNIEYIIVDNISYDGTLDIIRKYQKNYPIKLISEKDSGIYNAMNKGIDLSAGNYINFMNSGDYFFSNNIISNIIPELKNNYDVVYGDTEIRYKNFSLIKKERTPKKLWMGPINHQSSFIKTSLLKKYKYNENNNLVADFEFFLKIYYKNKNFLKINKVISSFSNDGITQKKDKQVILDSYKTITKFKKNITIKIYYKLLLIKPCLKKILPKRIFKLLKNTSSKLSNF